MQVYGDIVCGTAEEIRLNPAEVCRRLQVPRGFGSDAAERCEKQLRAAMTCRYAYVRLPVDYPERGVCRFDFAEIRSEDLYRNLAGCREAFVFAATIGIGVDRLLHRLNLTSQAEHFITDALASAAVESLCDFVIEEITSTAVESLCDTVIEEISGAAVESLCDTVTEEIAGAAVESLCDTVIKEISGAAGEALCDCVTEEIRGADAVSPKCVLRPRFSPGYGDTDLSVQKPLLRRLQADKTLGITLNSAYLMTPVKSVTAIAGLI